MPTSRSSLKESSRFSFRRLESDSIQQSVVKNGAKGEFALPETIGSGLAIMDYDLDGWLDVVWRAAGNAMSRTKESLLCRQFIEVDVQLGL